MTSARCGSYASPTRDGSQAKEGGKRRGLITDRDRNNECFQWTFVMTIVTRVFVYSVVAAGWEPDGLACL